ncbi:hypothetical protein AOQ84DRAFT_422230 [Glonium stellatum]|uniref:Uncharacterized protein n=1 Tax=Glonium stellatum TaxID=574774 RepID=A0A8E2JML3_9PEZI|nr:hypothetical protein AOQ84DRAFT_422230 [Glonium stellatum]
MSATNSIEERLGWVSSPDGRGTIDIIWSCILTTFLCVWTVLLLNVPPKDTSLWKFIRKKLKWMAIALFGPEWLTAFAGAQWSIARSAVKQFKAAGIEWTMRQAFFADMGGIRVRLNDDEFPVTSKHMFVLISLGLIKPSSITPEAIDDRSKTDGVAKLVTILQTVWFILQCVARLLQQISITTLELSTIAFVAAAINEAVNWTWSPLERFDDLRPNLLADAWPLLKNWPLLKRKSSQLNHDVQKASFRNDRLPPFEKDWTLISFFIIVSLCFGAVYVAGWNVSLPTYVEQVIWRVCIVTTLSLVVAFWLAEFIVELHLHYLGEKVAENEKVAVTPVKLGLFGAIATVYVLVRLYILVEGFVALRSLPVVAFKTVSWTNFLPHV